MAVGVDFGCSNEGAVVTFYVEPSGREWIIAARCAEECYYATPTPRPTQVATPPPWPCSQEPVPGGPNITQPCTNQYPGWDLTTSAQIPPVNAARNPWPRSLVGADTRLCYVGGPDSAETFSNAKAFACDVDYGVHDTSTFNCGSPLGQQGEGARVNVQLGVAWRRYTGASNPFGVGLAHPSAFVLDDRDWNGGDKVIPIGPGQCLTYMYQTSSYGLAETGPKWNPDCQDRECGYAERVQDAGYSCEACDNCVCANCAPAYRAVIQTWWWPEWTWRFDEYQCVRKEWSECFYFDPATNNGKVPQRYAGCGSGKHASEENWYEEEICTGWAWKDTTEAWRAYDIRKLGFPSPFMPSSRTAMAGMDPDGNVRTGFVYSPSVPVIEIQPVHP